MVKGGRQQRPPAAPYGLTSHERIVLELLVSGKSNKELGRILNISTFTVNGYVKIILRKMGVASRTEAAVRAVREALVA
jgi:DNA-binding NarL/FixJ family response regulator